MVNVTNFYNKYIPKDIVLLKKFPVYDLRNIIKMECNTDKVNDE